MLHKILLTVILKRFAHYSLKDNLVMIIEGKKFSLHNWWDFQQPWISYFSNFPLNWLLFNNKTTAFNHVNFYKKIFCFCFLLELIMILWYFFCISVASLKIDCFTLKRERNLKPVHVNCWMHNNHLKCTYNLACSFLALLT